jgi:DNA-binding transcriptional LysR family regulator
MAEWAGEVYRASDALPGPLQGIVRLAAPTEIAFEYLVPFAAELLEAFPKIRLEVLSSVHTLDLVRREADLALRFVPPQKELMTVTSVPHPIGVFASEAYAKTLPTKPKLEDLCWIAWAPPFDFSPNPELRARIPGFEPMFASDDYLIQIRAAEHGIGAIILGRSHRKFASLSLVDLRIDLGDVKRALHLVCAKSALDIPRIRTVSELLSAFLQKPPRSPVTPVKKPRTRTHNL